MIFLLLHRAVLRLCSLPNFLGAFNDNLYKTALFVLISFYGLGDGLWLSAPMMLNVGALLFVCHIFCFPRWQDSSPHATTKHGWRK